jgi:exopolyphosphatase/pppGpp-phosphohydrolase
MTAKQLEYVTQIAEKYKYGKNGWNKNHAEKVATLTQSILKQFANLNLVASEDADLLLARAVALPHDIGRNDNAKGERWEEHNVRSFKTLREELRGGPLDEDEATVIQYCALFHTGNEWRNTIVPRKPDLTKKLAGILRIADSLDYGLSQIVKDVVATLQPEQMTFKVIASGPVGGEIKRAEQKKDLAEVIYGRKFKVS